MIHLLFQKIQRTHFLNGILSDFKFFINGFNLIDLYQYHSPFFFKSPKNSTHNPSCELFIYFFKVCDIYYFVRMYSICSSSSQKKLNRLFEV